tara:strand:- start:231 stop:1181 length:951 start_codon:yes stop_codon:yes gene_type:complete
MKINVALFGLGRIGAMHAQNIKKNNKFNLKYVYDVNKKLSLNVSKKLKTINIKNPYIAFKDKSIKVIFISSTTSTHIPLITIAAKYKKIIFCEKPLDLNINRVIKCRKQIKKFKPKIQLGFNRRYDPGHFYLKKSLVNGKIGKLEKIIITSRDPAPPSLNYLKNSGGIFRDMTIHDFDLARFYLAKDPVKEIFASATNLSDSRFKKINDYEIATCILKSKKGVIIVINNSRHCGFGYDQRVEIFGNRGMLISDNKRKYNFFIDRYKIAYKLQLNDLYNLVKKNKKPRSTFDDGEKSLRIANGAFKSLKSKKTVTIK